MSGATCPACGVAVLPGYARCPKCRRPLPRRAATQVQGGTAVEERRRWPLFAVLGGTIAVIAIGVALASGDDKPAPTQPVQPAPQVEAPSIVAPPPPTFANEPPTAQQPTGPDPAELASALQQDLKRQRLWATVTVSGSRVEVRSGSCSDPAMAPALDSAAAGFKAAGLTNLRCVEQSGRVVVDRAL